MYYNTPLLPLTDLAVSFAESMLYLSPPPVTIALGRIFEMDPYVRDRAGGTNPHHGHGGLVGGVILAGIGVLLLLQNLGIPYFEDLERYWPVILIVVGLAQAARSMGMGGRVWGGAVFIVGIIFLLNNFGVIHGNIWRFLWPGILILVGLGMLARTIDRQGRTEATIRGRAAANAKKFGRELQGSHRFRHTCKNPMGLAKPSERVGRFRRRSAPRSIRRIFRAARRSRCLAAWKSTCAKPGRHARRS